MSRPPTRSGAHGPRMTARAAPAVHPAAASPWALLSGPATSAAPGAGAARAAPTPTPKPAAAPPTAAHFAIFGSIEADDLASTTPAPTPPPPGPSAARALAAASAAIASLGPDSPVERLLRADAAAALRDSGGAPCARAVARSLARAGWRARTRDALPAPPSVRGRAVFEHLRHAFVVVDSLGSPGGPAELIVDAAFADGFAVRGAPAAYGALVSRLPALFVGPPSSLERLVRAVGAALEACFKDAGSALPPWRSAKALLSKWRPAAWADGPALLPCGCAAGAAGGALAGADGEGAALESTCHHLAHGPPTGASPLSPAACGLGCCNGAASPPASPRAGAAAAACTPPAALGAAPMLASLPPRPPLVAAVVPRAGAAAAIEAAGRSLLSSRLAAAAKATATAAPATATAAASPPRKAGLLAAAFGAPAFLPPVRQVKLAGAVVA